MKLGYARISTSDQDASMQIEALISVGVDPKRIFTDELSGAREAKERPGMKALMDYAREEDDIYFWRLDRIGRSVIDVLNTVNEFTSRGIRLHSIMDNLDPTSVQVLRRSSRCLIPEGAGVHRRARGRLDAVRSGRPSWWGRPELKNWLVPSQGISMGAGKLRM